MVVFFVAKALYVRFAQVDWGKVEFRVSFLVLGVICTLIARGMLIVPFRLLLGSFQQPPGWKRMIPVAWIPPIGKYIPGKVASVGSAIWLLHRCNVPSAIAAGCVLILNAVIVLVGLILGAPLTLYGYIPTAIPVAPVVCCLMLATGCILLHPRVILGVGNRILTRLRRPTISWKPTLSHYAAPILAILVQWCFAGFALWSVAHAVAGVRFDLVMMMISGFALAGTLGFLALFAPGGLGVQEGILLLVLAPVMESSDTAITIVTIRLIQAAAEAVLALVGFVILRVVRCEPAEGLAQNES